jgi:hypothetical protein
MPETGMVTPLNERLIGSVSGRSKLRARANSATNAAQAGGFPVADA